MGELFATYSIEQIIIFVFILASSGKKIFDLIDYYKNKGRQVYKKEADYETCLVEFKKLSEEIQIMNKRLDILTSSDMDATRGWIVEKYNYYKDNPEESIDEYVMDTIERRYTHYKEEGGNSYVTSIVESLRERYKEE